MEGSQPFKGTHCQVIVFDCKWTQRTGIASFATLTGVSSFANISSMIRLLQQFKSCSFDRFFRVSLYLILNYIHGCSDR